MKFEFIVHVRCDRCLDPENYGPVIIFKYGLQSAINDAIAIFKQKGWTRLPNSLWLCPAAHKKNRKAA